LTMMTVNISRSHRITVLLVLDFIFFLTELVVGEGSQLHLVD
jgi:hypothetical protein